MKPGQTLNDLKKAKDDFFQAELLGRQGVHNGKKMVSTPGHHPVSARALQHHLQNGSMSFITAHNPSAQQLSPDNNKKRNALLAQDLTSKGAIFHAIKGKYGGNLEDSFLVHHTSTVSPNAINQLGVKYGQESILHTSKGQHRLHYVSGEHVGKHHKGAGHTLKTKARDNFSAVAERPKKKFALKLDFEALHKAQALSHRPRVPDSMTLTEEDGSETEFNLHLDLDKLHE